MASTTTHVFISHGKADAWVAGQMARCVRDCGATTFLDETDIAKGDDLKARIYKEISNCNELVALFTPWSASRFWVMAEVGAAWGQGKRVIAILYGLSVTQLEDIGGSKGVFEDINILPLLEFDSYISELSARVTETKNV